MGSLSENKIFLTVAETAKILGVSRPTVTKLCRAGRIPCFNVGTGKNQFFKIPSEGLEQYIFQQTAAGRAVSTEIVETQAARIASKLDGDDHG